MDSYTLFAHQLSSGNSRESSQPCIYYHACIMLSTKILKEFRSARILCLFADRNACTPDDRDTEQQPEDRIYRNAAVIDNARDHKAKAGTKKTRIKMLQSLPVCHCDKSQDYKDKEREYAEHVRQAVRDK